MAEDKYRGEALGYLFEGTEDYPPDSQSHMEYYLRNIPRYLKNILGDKQLSDSLDRISDVIADNPKSSLIFTGCGTSFHAVSVAKYVFEAITGRAICTVYPSEIVKYHSPWVGKEAIVLVLSHSGRARIAVESVEFAKSKGAKTIALTGLADSPLAAASDYSIITPGGRESSLPKTKSYLCALMTLYLLALRVAKKVKFWTAEQLGQLEGEVRAVPEIIRKGTAEMEGKVKELSYRWAGKKSYYFVGSYYNYPTVQEAALKYKETNYETAEGEDMEEMAHGPLAQLGDNSVLVIVAPDTTLQDRALTLIRASKAVNIETLVLTSRKTGLCEEASECLVFPDGTSELTSPMVYIVPLYFMTYYTALAKNANPDLCRTDVPEYARSLQLLFPPGFH